MTKEPDHEQSFEVSENDAYRAFANEVIQGAAYMPSIPPDAGWFIINLNPTPGLILEAGVDIESVTINIPEDA